MPAAKKSSAKKRVGRPLTVQATGISGTVVAPAIGAVIADTGPLTPGVYNVTLVLASDDTPAAIGKNLTVQRRNAANGATVETLAVVPIVQPTYPVLPEVTILDSERIRVVAGSVAGTAASSYSAYIFARQVR